MEAAREGLIEQEERVDPMRGVSSAVVANMWNMVDSAHNDFSFENPPPHGNVVAVSPEFGESFENAFYNNWNEETRHQMENIGRAVQVVYEEDGHEYLGFGGTLEKPEIYRFSEIDGARAAYEDAIEEGSVDFENL